KKPPARERMFHLHIAIAPTKNMARMEWFVEKVTELGIDEITPIFCQQSERTKIRLDRLEKIAISAMKQSLRSYLPKINAPVKMNQLLSNYQSETARLNKYIAHCESTKKVNLWDTYRMGKDALILIGPEGDFSSQEIEQALSLNFKAISLGTHRLRTETAGITACNVINIVNQKGEI
ncbi:MAG: RsmE family RNA methyltransferase, partial [Bacteroidota bacterium]